MSGRSPDDNMTIDEFKTRVMHMVSELCGDEQCAIFPSLEQCVNNAVTARWSSPIKSFIPLLAYREVRQCIEQGYCPDLVAGTTA